MQEIITREDARARGLKRYFIGPCARGHTSERGVSSNKCLKCDSESHYVRKRAPFIPVCAECSAEMVGKRCSKYCSVKCRDARNRRRFTRPPRVLTCKCCGNPFLQERTHLYCSAKCKQESIRAMKRKRERENAEKVALYRRASYARNAEKRRAYSQERHAELYKALVAVRTMREGTANV